MASIILAQAGSVIGGSLGGAIGSAIGYGLGNFVGSHIDNTLFASNNKRHTHGTRLSDLIVQSSSYGKIIPDLYGTARLAGNIIWAMPLFERGYTQYDEDNAHTSYNYTATVAIAICKGTADNILRIWADTKELNLAEINYRFYKGDAQQLPDPLIEAQQGIGATPAYRGLAYVVIEDFPLEQYGNRIPNFTFEIKKRLNSPDSTEELIENMVMIPGSGEFVYDTIVQSKIYGIALPDGSFIQSGTRIKINENNNKQKADALVALDQLQETCSNLKWVAPVVTWFSTSLNIEDAKILPGVEYNSGKTTPDLWQVANFNRESAHQITKDKVGSPIYGGSVNDASVVRYLQELKSRNLKIMFYPMPFIDQIGKPWRGRLTGNATSIKDFFNKDNGYNNFILHYANLAKGKIDAFIIGSELIGLTKIKDSNNNFPAVNELIALAIKVKKILGNEVKIIYAADWSEYHHTDSGWYNLDPLWACDAIDIIGIDAYFPLTTNPTNSAYKPQIKQGWCSGEGYDYYIDNNGVKKPLDAAYAWKNIKWWWENEHFNPDGKKTAFSPKSKKIWFTEFGFPSVDNCTNQPNVFYDPNSSEGNFPKNSNGSIDFYAQNQAINASLKFWQDSLMIEKMFLWTWDARPYPFWPSLDTIWKDSKLWAYGHWVNGKLGCSSLAYVVWDLCIKSGLLPQQIDCTELKDVVEGYVLTTQTSARNCIEALANAYFFEAIETSGKIKFITKKNKVAIKEISNLELVPINSEVLNITRRNELEVASAVDVLYIDKSVNYQQNISSAKKSMTLSKRQFSLNISLILSPSNAHQIAQTMLCNNWLERTSYKFYLSVKYACLEPGDVIILNNDTQQFMMRIITINLNINQVMEITAVNYCDKEYNYQLKNIELPSVLATGSSFNSEIHLLDLPLLPNNIANQTLLYIAACGLEAEWGGIDIYYSINSGTSYKFAKSITKQVIIGTTLNRLGSSISEIRDDYHQIEVIILNGELESYNEETIEQNNLALIGDEIIQFTNAKLIAPNHYILSNIYRGCLGTEEYISSHTANEKFILLDNISSFELPLNLINSELKFKVCPRASNAKPQFLDFNYKARMFKPFSVAHVNYQINETHDIEVNWIRRARQNIRSLDASTPLFEVKELYEIDIIHDNKVVRTIISDVPKVLYLQSEMLADCKTNKPKLVVEIFQISDLIARGTKASIIIDLR
jgi:hypothetical protein